MKITASNDINLLEHDGAIYLLNKIEKEDLDQMDIEVNLKSILSSKLEKEIFCGKYDEIIRVDGIVESEVKSFYFVGIGENDKYDSVELKKTINSLMQTLEKEKCINPVMFVDFASIDEEQIKTICETLIIAEYKFDNYLTKKKTTYIENMTIKTDLQESIKEGALLGEITNLTRELVNEPANIMTPKKLASRAKKAGKKYGFEVKIHEKDYIQENNMHAYYEVAKASSNKPRLIVMKYFGNPDNEEIVGLVGKGLTFDSGGYSLKPGNSMITMKSDMGGAAAVIGAISAISSMKLKVNVYAVVAACENMINSNGYRPGDIIDSMAGKSIFIKTTDAEGRLTLVDAVTYSIRKLGVSKIIDIATLTGSQIHALGHSVTGVLSNDDLLFSKIQYGSDMSGELIWRMPTYDVYKKLLEHKEADLTNATSEAGMICAGMFIEAFTEGKPWVHMDIAGPSYTESTNGIISYGSTGTGARTLYYALKDISNSI